MTDIARKELRDLNKIPLKSICIYIGIIYYKIMSGTVYVIDKTFRHYTPELKAELIRQLIRKGELSHAR